MASVFFDVHLPNATLMFFPDGNCFIDASTVNEYSLSQMILSMEADSSTSSPSNALLDRRSWTFDILFHGIWAVTNPYQR